MNIVARLDSGAFADYHGDPVIIEPAPEPLKEPSSIQSAKLQEALAYLGPKHISRLDSTFKPSKESVLDQWRLKRLEQRVKKPRLKPV